MNTETEETLHIPFTPDPRLVAGLGDDLAAKELHVQAGVYIIWRGMAAGLKKIRREENIVLERRNKEDENCSKKRGKMPEKRIFLCFQLKHFGAC